jgi:apocytochrome f
MYLKTFATFLLSWLFLFDSPANAYPIFAQQNYKTPLEENGRIVCANCHLAQGLVKLTVPQAVLPDTVFTVDSKIPYELRLKQVLGDGKLGNLNVGAVLILPEGFQLAPPDRLSRREKEKTRGLYYQPYSSRYKNILVVGPVPGNIYQNITYPIVAPDPTRTKKVSYGKFAIYLGGNRGRGQIYPDGSKSNNTMYVASTTGVIKDILPAEKIKGFRIVVETADGSRVTDIVPPGPKLVVKPGQKIYADQPVTTNPNVGGFGQTDEELVLQCPQRVQSFLVFACTVFVAQICFVLKKKQFEKFQLSEITF